MDPITEEEVNSLIERNEYDTNTVTQVFEQFYGKMTIAFFTFYF